MTAPAGEPTPPDGEPRPSQEDRIRAMQFDQFPVEGGAPKARLGLWSATFVTLLAAVLPIRVRTAFGFGLNFVTNSARASVVLVGAWLSRGVTGAAIFFVYWFVIGPTSLVARWILRRDDLRLGPVQGSFFTEKDPPDTTEDRFLRQF